MMVTAREAYSIWKRDFRRGRLLGDYSDYNATFRDMAYRSGLIPLPPGWKLPLWSMLGGPLGGVRNVERRIEFAWYLGGQGIRPAPRGEFYATQWGDIVSGPADPVCGTQRTYGDRSYTVLCLRQYVAPTVQPMTFPGNAIQRTFPSNGVVLPN